MEHISETVKSKITQATMKVKINKREKKQGEEEQEVSDDDLDSMADECCQILDSDEEREKIVHVVEKGGKKGKTSKSTAKIDPELKKDGQEEQCDFQGGEEDQHDDLRGCEESKQSTQVVEVHGAVDKSICWQQAGAKGLQQVLEQVG